LEALFKADEEVKRRRFEAESAARKKYIAETSSCKLCIMAKQKRGDDYCDEHSTKIYDELCQQLSKKN
jgi:hypothetical protein